MLETPTRNHPTVVLSRIFAVAIIMAMVIAFGFALVAALV